MQPRWRVLFEANRALSSPYTKYQMRLLAGFLLPFVLFGQSDRNLAGVWKIAPESSQIRDVSPAPTGYLKITQTPAAVTVIASASEDAPGDTATYPLNGTSSRNKLGDLNANIVTKWEGTSLLANVIVSGRQDYSVRERWTRSADGNTLTVERTVSRPNSETESRLVYTNASAPVVTQKAPEQPGPGPVLQRRANSPVPPPAEASITVPAGTRILLRLTNALNTKHTVAGDHLYLETAVPIFIGGKLIIPVRSYVAGTVLDSKRAGRVKGLADLNFRFDSLTLPNGVTRDFRSRAGSVDTAGSLDRTEGAIKGESNKGGDARKVATTAGAGAGIGSLAGIAAGHAAAGAGIGAAAGAIGGLASVLGSRGPDVTLPAGTTMEMVLDREIQFTPDELRRIQ